MNWKTRLGLLLGLFYLLVMFILSMIGGGFMLSQLFSIAMMIGSIIWLCITIVAIIGIVALLFDDAM